ncbi:MFS transporter [Trichocoleus sp. FACHB-262]|uniref:MFS transporter n=1 Tax=Trichocoleus sp. FACHB-262 TaxID=2692869 RepID=UPI0016863CDF|nr:MFS transporter [Trichocoleus sp. FACHB-262]MBD2124587.1 MFS transporter [Trichocoleus sp. FACHB-262]
MQQDRSTPSRTAQATISRKAITFIFITVLLDLLGAGILVPVIPFLVGQFNQDALMVGLLALSFYAAQFLATPALGSLSDRFGRRPVLIISVLGTGISHFLFGFANSLWLLFAARLLDGITGGNISVAQAYIADASAPQDRTKNFGLIGAAFGVGFIMGPALGGWLSQISLQAPAFVAGGLSLITTAFGFFVLPESLPPARRVKGTITLKDLNPLGQVGGALQRLGLRGLLLANFAQNFAFSALQTNFVLFTFIRFGLGPAQNGSIFAYVGFVSGLMQGLITGQLARRFYERKLMAIGLAMMAFGYAGLALAPEIPMLYLALTFTAVGSGITNPTLTSLISKQVSSQEQGTVLGATQALASLALIVGPVWAGITFDKLGPSAPYWTGAVWLAIAVLFAGGARAARRVPNLNEAR